MILVDILDDEIDSPQMTRLVERFADQLNACGELLTRVHAIRPILLPYYNNSLTPRASPRGRPNMAIHGEYTQPRLRVVSRRVLPYRW